VKSQRDVRIVAFLFVLSGVGALASAIQSGRFVLSSGLLGIPIGIGLLRYQSLWRTFALIWLWLGLICLPLLGVMALIAMNSVSAFGRRSTLLLGAAIVLGFLFEYWQYRVLTRPEVRRWFDLGEASVA
jgi:hypothetical protein